MSLESTPKKNIDLLFLNELSIVKKEQKKKLQNRIIKKLINSGLNEVRDISVESFIEKEYENLENLIDELTPEELRKKFIVFVQKEEQKAKEDLKDPRSLSEAINTLLTEADDIEAADPVDMFQDFSDISGQLASIYSTLVIYNSSYISNPKVKESISYIMKGVSSLIQQSTKTMQMLGSSLSLTESVNFNNQEEWGPKEWEEFEKLSVMDKMKLVSSSDYFKHNKKPRSFGIILSKIKKWATSNYKGWERVATTTAGKRSIVRQYLAANASVPTDKLSEMLDEIVKWWS